MSTKKKSTLVFLILIGLITAIMLFLRFYNLDQRIIFDWDQESYANQIKDVVVNHKVSLLGPRTTNATGFYLAPYFTYLMLPFYLVTKLHPIGSIYFIIAYNLIFVTGAFLLLRKVFDLKVVAAFFAFWSINFLMVEYDIIPWWPVVLPLGVLATLFLLRKATTEKKLLNWILLGLCLGLFANMHFQFVFVILFTIFFLGYHFWSTKTNALKPAITTIAAFIATLAPLLLFDLRHQFLNTKLFFGFFFGGGSGVVHKDPIAWIPVLTNFLQPFLVIRNDILTLAFYIALGVGSFLLFKKAKDFRKEYYFASLCLWVAVPLFFAFYGQRPSEYYFVFLLPFVLITLSDGLIRNKLTPVLLLLFVISIYSSFNTAFNYTPIQSRLKTHPFGLYNKQKVVTYLKDHYDLKTYNVSFTVEPGREPGFRYLMYYENIKTHDIGDPKNPLIQVKIPPTDEDIKVTDTIGLQIPPEFKNGK
jgi:hypothetical protein